MEGRTFSAIEAVKYGYRTFFNHIILFVSAMLVIGIILVGLPLLAGHLLNPTLTAELIPLLKKVVQSLATRDEIMSFVSQHSLFCIIVIPIFQIVATNLLAGLFQIAFDIFDTGSSTLTRLFSLFPHALQVSVISLLLGALHQWEYIIRLPLPKMFPALYPTHFIDYNNPSESLPAPAVLQMLLFAILALTLGLFMLYMSVRTLFALIVFIDQKKGIVQSFVHSWKITLGNVFDIVIFFICEIITVIVPIFILSFFFGIEVSIMAIFGIVMITAGIPSLIYVYRALSSNRK